MHYTDDVHSDKLTYVDKSGTPNQIKWDTVPLYLNSNVREYHKTKFN